ncbi:hypothetical protein AMELA_G00127360 [Ameiurus melas]|uniref:Uncharacterized protein n=1 Tax=Ameiurus melas TaxID=219545 RepID=A0A7J6AQQ0_AMEME|nr:hypothetical protein AMELA_G00127360 [Ameiurus melas]
MLPWRWSDAAACPSGLHFGKHFCSVTQEGVGVDCLVFPQRGFSRRLLWFPPDGQTEALKVVAGSHKRPYRM